MTVNDRYIIVNTESGNLLALEVDSREGLLIINLEKYIEWQRNQFAIALFLFFAAFTSGSDSFEFARLTCPKSNTSNAT